MLDDDDDNPNSIEGELAIPKRSEGEISFEVRGVAFELEIERAGNGKVALTIEAEKPEDDDDDDDDDDGPDEDFQFVFNPNDGFEDSFEIEVGNRTYLIEVEAGIEDEDDDEDDDDDDDDDDDGADAPELVAEIEVTPLGQVRRGRLAAEFEIEAARGKEIDGEFEYRGLAVELGLEPASARGRRYVLEVEIEDERSGETYEREFNVRPGNGFEREFELTFGARTFEVEIEVERDREDDTVVASLEIERATAAPDDFLI